MYLLFNQNREINQKDIGHEFKIKNPTVTGILKRLEIKGLVRRVPSQHDGRFKQITVTDRSRKMEKEISEKGELIEKRLVNGLLPEEQRQLLMLLQKILGNLYDD